MVATRITDFNYVFQIRFVRRGPANLLNFQVQTHRINFKDGLYIRATISPLETFFLIFEDDGTLDSVIEDVYYEESEYDDADSDLGW